MLCIVLWCLSTVVDIVNRTILSHSFTCENLLDGC